MDTEDKQILALLCKKEEIERRTWRRKRDDPLSVESEYIPLFIEDGAKVLALNDQTKGMQIYVGPGVVGFWSPPELFQVGYYHEVRYKGHLFNALTEEPIALQIPTR